MSVTKGGEPLTKPDMDQVALDQYVDLLRRLNEATKARLGWAKIEGDLKEQIAKLLGDAEQGTVNGELAFERKPIAQFNTTNFKKDEPDQAKFYTRKKEVEVIDVDLIRQTNPDLYTRYQTVKLINHFEG
jgi:hypothetical protein